MRKFNWLVPVAVAVCLVGYFVVWPWWRSRDDVAFVESLTSDLGAASRNIDRAIVEAPATPKAADLERFSELNKKTRELAERMREIAPILQRNRRPEFLEAHNLYLKQVDRYREQVDRMGKALNEMKAKINAGNEK